MSTTRLAISLLAGHVFVACVAWCAGYSASRLHQQQQQRFGATNAAIIKLQAISDDLVDAIVDIRLWPAPYDWQRDGECIQRGRVS